MKVKLKILAGIMCVCILIPFYTVYGFEMKGFADLTYLFSPSEKAAEENKNGSFILGQLDYFTATNITDRIDMLSEIVFEAPNEEMVLDIERIEIGYVFNDWLNIRAGRFHTPLGYYANIYHHGRQLDALISRPLILEFEDEGGLVPAHVVGLWLRGKILTKGMVKYSLGVGNGQKIDVDKKELVINMANDDNKNKIVLAQLTYEFPFGLGLGTSLYAGKVNGYTQAAGVIPVVDVNQTISGLNLYYEELPIHLAAEYYTLTNKDLLVQPAKKYTASGYFVQTAYEFKKLYEPYFRYEEINPEEGDPYATNLMDKDTVTRLTYGIKYNLSDESAIKVEGIQETKSAESINIFGCQWAFAF